MCAEEEMLQLALLLTLNTEIWNKPPWLIVLNKASSKTELKISMGPKKNSLDR